MPNHPLAIAREAVHKRGAVQSEIELAEFIALAMNIEPKVIVEIGSYAGGTLWAWMQICPRVIGIDLPPKGQDTGPQLNSLGCEVLLGDSHDPTMVRQLREMLGGSPIDILFIDADHTYEGVKTEYELYSPLVRPGGVVGFHDIAGHPTQTFVEVDRFWATLDGDKEEFICTPRDGYGIGVQWVPLDLDAQRMEREATLARYRAAADRSYHKPGAKFQKVR